VINRPRAIHQEREFNMIVNLQVALRTLAAAAVLALGMGQAQAQTYNFSQSFGAFGSVSGQFTGTDGSTDGNIDGLLDETEVSFLSLNFSGGLGNLSYGNSEIYISTFNWVTGDLGTITNPTSGFDLTGFPDSGTGLAMNWVAGEGAGLGLDEGQLYLYDAATNDPAASLNAIGGTAVNIAPVTPVPEPESYLMMALGLAGLVAGKRRQRA
jgi:hypothetical protein